MAKRCRSDECTWASGHYALRRGKGHRAEGPAPFPVLPYAVTEQVWSFFVDDDVESVWSRARLAEVVDPAARGEARRYAGGASRFSCVSRAWLDYARRHRRLITASWFVGQAAFFAAGPYPRATVLDATNCEWLDDGVMRVVGASKRTLFPAVRCVDVSGCRRVSSIGTRAVVKALEGTLVAFAQDATPRFQRCKDMRLTGTALRVLATASPLVSLSITVPSSVKGPRAFAGLASHETLRSLSVFFEGFLPPPLPSIAGLEHLAITTGPWCYFPWRCLVDVPFPHLRSLRIHDRAGDDVDSLDWLTATKLLTWLHTGLPTLETCVLRHVCRVSNIRSDPGPYRPTVALALGWPFLRSDPSQRDRLKDEAPSRIALSLPS